MLNFFSKRKNIYIVLLAILAGSLVIEFIFPNEHPYYIWHEIPGADIIIGFVGCFILIRILKAVVARLIQKEEDYFDDGGEHFDD